MLNIGPDLGPNYLQWLSADDKLPLARKEFLVCIELSSNEGYGKPVQMFRLARAFTACIQQKVWL